MAKKRNRKSKRSKCKNTGQTAHASLAGFAPLIESKGIFDKIHQQVEIPQKQLVYRPTDKLIFVVLGLFVGCEHIDEINHRLRPDKVLLSGFGYDSCADQSVIQDTLHDLEVYVLSELKIESQSIDKYLGMWIEKPRLSRFNNQRQQAC